MNPAGQLSDVARFHETAKTSIEDKSIIGPAQEIRKTRVLLSFNVVTYGGVLSGFVVVGLGGEDKERSACRRKSASVVKAEDLHLEGVLRVGSSSSVGGELAIAHRAISTRHHPVFVTCFEAHVAGSGGRGVRQFVDGHVLAKCRFVVEAHRAALLEG